MSFHKCGFLKPPKFPLLVLIIITCYVHSWVTKSWRLTWLCFFCLSPSCHRLQCCGSRQHNRVRPQQCQPITKQPTLVFDLDSQSAVSMMEQVHRLFLSGCCCTSIFRFWLPLWPTDRFSLSCSPLSPFPVRTLVPVYWALWVCRPALRRQPLTARPKRWAAAACWTGHCPTHSPPIASRWE